MYIRQHFRNVDGQRKAYWALVESVRTERGPQQRVVAWLGALDEAGRLGVLRAAEEQSGSLKAPGSNCQLALFDYERVLCRTGVGTRQCESGFELRTASTSVDLGWRFSLSKG